MVLEGARNEEEVTEGMGMRRRKGNRQSRRVGQSVIEYLVIAAVVIAAIIAIRITVSQNMNLLMEKSADRVGQGATEIEGLTFTAF